MPRRLPLVALGCLALLALVAARGTPATSKARAPGAKTRVSIAKTSFRINGKITWITKRGYRNVLNQLRDLIGQVRALNKKGRNKP